MSAVRILAALVLAFATCVSRGAAAAPNPADEAATAAKQLADRLKKAAPPKPPEAGCSALYLMDLVAGGVTLVESVGDEGWEKANFGSPSWSADGRRIYYDVSPDKSLDQTRIFQIELAGDGLNRAVVGVGSCPVLSPDGKQLAFVLNPRSVPGADRSVYVGPPAGGKVRSMKLYGYPRWSPTSKELLVAQFGTRIGFTLVNPEDGSQQQVVLAGHTFPSAPCWAGDKLLTAVVKSGDDTSIVLLDVTAPGEAKVKETLWRKNPGAPVAYVPAVAVYSPAGRRGAFIAWEEPKPKQLYAFEPGKAPWLLEPDRKGIWAGTLALSPDGRYLLFCDDRWD